MDPHAMSVEQLEQAIQYHNWKYWVDNAPEISDYDFDRLVEALRQRKPDSPLLDAIGAEGGGALGDDGREQGEKVAHARLMLSLDKCYSDEELLKWFDKFEGDAVASAKIDGVAASLRYDETGRLALAATRGSGKVGEVITPNIRYVDGVPTKVPAGPVEVRGELYMPLSVFRREFAESFANPRNLTAGAIKQKEAQNTAGYRLRFTAYDVDVEGGPDTRPGTEVEKTALLERLGFGPVQTTLVNRDTAPAVYQTLLAERDHLDFETDGVVFRANSCSEQERMGHTAHHPRYAIAYKFQGDTGTSTLVEVEWSVSRTGAINPVALVEPVTLSGASVTRASLHNLGIMAKLGGDQGLRLGSRVLMMRRGGVIPHVEQVLEWGEEPVAIPETCPHCGAPTDRRDDVLWADHTPRCSATRLGAIQHFVQVIEARGFGPKLLAQLIEVGLVSEPADLMKLSADDLLGLERVGPTLATKLIDQLEARRTLPLDVLLRALGIDELGPHVAGLLAERYGDIAAVRAATQEELADIHGVGEVIAEKVVSGLVERSEEIDRLLACITPTAVEATAPPAEDGALGGLSVLFTGTLERMKRAEAQALVRSLGGDTPSSVTKTLTHLVLGDADLARFQQGWRSSKLKRVEALNQSGADIAIVGESHFFGMVERGAQR